MPTKPIDNQLQRNINLTILSGALAVIATNLTNPFFSLFVIRLGGSDFHIAWLSALPALASMLVLIPGGAFVDRFIYKKQITCILTGANRFFFLCLALVPFLPAAWQATIFVVFVGLMRLPGSVGEIAWQSFFADFVPEEQRGFAMAKRSRVSTFVGLIITLAAGQILSTFPQSDAVRTQFYQVFFVLAFFVSCYEVYTMNRIKETDYSKEDAQASEALTKLPLKERFKAMFGSFKDTPQAKRFLIFASCSLVFHFGWQMGWPLFNIYQIKNLHSNEMWLAIIAFVGGIASTLTYYPWSKFAAKIGNDRALAITGIGMGLTPILYAISDSLPVLAAMNIMVGISTAGFTLILFNITLNEAPKIQRTLYIACYNTIISISAVLAPNVGVSFSELWGIHAALLITAFFRFLGVFAFFFRWRYHSKEEKLKATA